MSDFVPGYVTTFANPNFDKLTANIILVGMEDGKVYSTFATKDDLFKRMANRKKRDTMMCYYRVIDFTPQEMEMAWSHSIHPVSEKEKNRITYQWNKDLATICQMSATPSNPYNFY